MSEMVTYVRVKQACEMMGISKSLFYDRLKKGVKDFPTIRKDGYMTVVPVSEIARWNQLVYEGKKSNV